MLYSAARDAAMYPGDTPSQSPKHRHSNSEPRYPKPDIDKVGICLNIVCAGVTELVDVSLQRSQQQVRVRPPAVGNNFA